MPQPVHTTPSNDPKQALFDEAFAPIHAAIDAVRRKEPFIHPRAIYAALSGAQFAYGEWPANDERANLWKAAELCEKLTQATHEALNNAGLPLALAEAVQDNPQRDAFANPNHSQPTHRDTYRQWAEENGLYRDNEYDTLDMRLAEFEKVNAEADAALKTHGTNWQAKREAELAAKAAAEKYR